MPRLITASRFLAWITLLGASTILLVASGFYLYLRPGLPPVHQLLDTRLQTPLRVLTSDNRLIAEFGEKRRTPVTIEQVPELQLQAFLAAEDSRFYEHFGVDIKGLARATTELVTTGEIQSGGSTITMQVAKNYFLTRDRTFTRKFNEILLAIQIERELSKDQILELYLNKIYLGNRAYGLAAAAQVYYDRPLDELTLAQMAMIAGLPKAPSAYNPLANPERALIRRNWILGRMRDLGHISQPQFNEAVNAPLTASFNAPRTEVNADYVAEMARAEMFARFGEAAYNDGYRVYVTITEKDQKAATRALQSGLEAYDRRHGYRGPVASIELPRPDRYRESLRGYPRIESQYPALVVSLDNEGGAAELYSRHLGKLTLPFEGARWARRYRNANSLGPEPGSLSDVLSVGDIVYVRRTGADENTPVDDDIDTLTDTEAAPLIQPLTVELGQVPDIQGALISLDAHTGAILGLAGGYSFQQTKYNRATQARRQPGSIFKPFVYLSALEQGMTAATIYNDAPIVYDDDQLEAAWRPQNSGGQFHGPTRLREALYRSRNLVSIRLLQDLGVNSTIRYLDQLGLPTQNLQRDLSLALGSGSMTPLDMARGFAVIANGGYDVQPFIVQRIEDSFGNVIFEAPAVIKCDQECDDPALDVTPEPGFPAARKAPRVADARSVYILHSILQDVITRGTGTRARTLGRDDLAGKTGTTNEQRDAWFAGFNHDISATAWIGFDQPAHMGRNEFGATAALPIWVDYMRDALTDRPESRMQRPNGIVSVRIDPETGQRASPGQSNAMFEIFTEETAPEERSARSGSSQGGSSRVPQDLF